MARKKHNKPKKPKYATYSDRIFDSPEPQKRQPHRPSWYPRISALAESRMYEGLQLVAQDFDEDISDTAVEEVAPWQRDLAMDYAGIDDESRDYWDFKEMRNDRKKDFAKMREAREGRATHAQEREDEVERVLFLQQLNRERATYDIYSAEYVRSWGEREVDSRPDMYIVARVFAARVVQCVELKGTHARIHLDRDFDIELEPFAMPDRAGSSSIDVEMLEFDGYVTISFIDRFRLKLLIPRDVAYEHVPTGIPETIEFVGISREFKDKRTRREAKEREEATRKRKQAEEWERREREYSPKDSWFEMDHPEGWWAQNRGF